MKVWADSSAHRFAVKAPLFLRQDSDKAGQNGLLSGGARDARDRPVEPSGESGEPIAVQEILHREQFRPDKRLAPDNPITGGDDYAARRTSGSPIRYGNRYSSAPMSGPPPWGRSSRSMSSTTSVLTPASMAGDRALRR